jgi:hypothetical protein
MEIECFCKQCKTITLHDFQASVNDDVLTTIAVCKKCGKATVDVGPVEMDCLVCTFNKENACSDCCRDWDNQE